MSFSWGGRLGALAAIVVTGVTGLHCGGNDSRRRLIDSGDDVRVVTADSVAGCPQGWAGSDYDDAGWPAQRLPIGAVPESVCLRKAFAAGDDIARYRWLKIRLSSRSQVQLSSSRPIRGDEERNPNGSTGGLNWSTEDADRAAASAPDDREYTVDLRLFPDLLHPIGNVLALQVAQTPRPLLVTAELDVDSASGDDDGVVRVAKGPYLVRPSTGERRIVWETDRSAPSWAMVDGRRYDGGFAVHHEVALTGLASGVSHAGFIESAEESALPPECYQAGIVAKTKQVVPEQAGDADDFWRYVERRGLCKRLAEAIRTRPVPLRPTAASDSKLRLAVIGATRSGSASQPSALLDAVAVEGAALVVHTGDLVASDYEAAWQTWFAGADAMLAAAPIVPVVGERDLPAWGSDRFGQLFSVAEDERLGHTYAVDEGPVHLALLDSTADLDAVAAWLETDLFAAELRGVKHRFVVLHWGPYSSGPSRGNGAAVASIVPVLRRHAVDAVLSGHDAIYEHGIADGVHYFVSGGAGNVVDAVHPTATALSAQSAANYLVLDVDGDQVRVQAKDGSGALLDDVTLTAPKI
jgi:hypothetical protein